jgi:chemotaxis signal transduction protein
LDCQGIIYPAFNLGQWLGLGKLGPIGFTIEPMHPAGKVQGIILLEKNKAPFGIVVDSVVGVTKLEDPTAHPAPNRARDIDPKFIKGYIYEVCQTIMIHDYERLLHAS